MISLEKLAKKYKNGNEAVWPVKDISLQINTGEFVSITGRSGSGKSTLLKMMDGLLVPTSGSVTIDGTDLYSLDDDGRADFRIKHTGFIFQDYFLEEMFTVSRNIEISLMIAGIEKGRREDIIGEVLDKVGLTDKRNSLVKDLSGGEKQRVSIARALSTNPEYIFADEPCGSLDYSNGAVIMKLLRNICDGGRTVVLVTHNMEDAGKTDRIVTLQDGCAVSDEKQ